MRTIPEAVEDIKSILNNIERTESCDGETLVDINELAGEILTINAYKWKQQTNADRIRSFSDEELAEFIEQISSDSMDTISFVTKDYEEIWEHKETALKWLQSEVEK